MRELFIYYRTSPASAAELQSRVAALQDRLRQGHAGLQARLLRRPEVDRGGLVTWMETYAMDPTHAGGVNDVLEAAIDAAARELIPLLVGPRHIERFDACAS